MTVVLTRAELVDQVDRFISGSIKGQALARWAFDRFYQREEGALDYEPGFGAVIDAVLEELTWADSAPFALSVEQAAQLRRRLAKAQPRADDELLDDDDVDWDEEPGVE